MLHRWSVRWTAARRCVRQQASAASAQAAAAAPAAQCRASLPSSARDLHCTPAVQSRRLPSSRFVDRAPLRRAFSSAASADPQRAPDPPPLPSSFASIPSALPLRARFALVERCLESWSTDGARWADCVRCVAELHRLQALQEEEEDDAAEDDAAEEECRTAEPDGGRGDGASNPSDAPRCALTLQHFHHALHSMALALHATMSPGEVPLALPYPRSMLGASWTDPALVSCCLGSSPSSGLRPFRPDFPAYARVMALVREGVVPRDHGLDQPGGRAGRHAAAAVFAASAENQIDGGATTAAGAEGESMWLLIMALEAYRAPHDIEVERAAQAECADDDCVDQVPLAVAAEVATAPSLPTLPVIRLLFSSLLSSALRPTRVTVNTILALLDLHSRASSGSFEARAGKHDHELDGHGQGEGGDAAEPSTSSSSAATAAADFAWTLWTDMTRLHGVHSDLLSRVLVLRVLYSSASGAGSEAWGRMARVMDDHSALCRVVASAQPVLNAHDFQQPHLLLDALTHSSAVFARVDSNERMEFLGDAVLDALVRLEVLRETGSGLVLSDRDAEAEGAKREEPDVTTPALLRAPLIPSHALGQLKGRFVSHATLSALARGIGLGNMLLEANNSVSKALLGHSNANAKRHDHRLRRGTTEKLNKTRASVKGKHRGALGIAGQGLDGEGQSFESPPPSEQPLAVLTEQAPDGAVAPTERDSERSGSGRTTSPSIPDSLSEDVFEACVGALYLDAPQAHDGGESLATRDVPATSGSQSYGMSAAREFVQRIFSPELRRDCLQAVVAHDRRSRGRSYRAAHRWDADSGAFDRKVNYKMLLELAVRARYTDAAGVCQAHVLYVLLEQHGGHSFRVRVTIKVLRAGQVDENRATGRGAFLNASSDPSRSPTDAQLASYRARVHYENQGLSYIRRLQLMNRDRLARGSSSTAATPSSDSSFFQADSPISFSIAPVQRPPFESEWDLEFAIAMEQPEQQNAEQMAAFFALHGLGVMHEREDGAHAKETGTHMW